MTNSELLEHKAKRTDYMADYYQAHKEKKSNYYKDYWKENKERITEKRRSKVYVKRKDIYRVLNKQRKQIGDASYFILVDAFEQLNTKEFDK